MELAERAKQGLGTLMDGYMQNDSEHEETAGDGNLDEDSDAQAGGNSREEEEEDEGEEDEMDKEEAEEGKPEEAEGRPDIEIDKDDKHPGLTKEVRVYVQCGDFKKRNRQALLPH